MRERHANRPPLILIADDVRDTREMYSLYLGMAGYRVETAADGWAAIVKARALQPDLIVMDLNMPEVDGWSAIKQLRDDADLASIPIIVLTGHDLKAYLKRAAMAAGAVSYVMKPCLPERLAREIGERLVPRPARIAGGS